LIRPLPRSKLRCSDDAPLLSGQAVIYRDGIFVGRGLMAAAARTKRCGSASVPRQGQDRAFGRQTQRGLAGLSVTTSKTDERSFKTTLRNGHDFPIKVAISINCRSAKTRHRGRDAAADDPPTASNTHDKRGVLEWAFEAKAGEVRDINFAWRLRWPKTRAW